MQKFIELESKSTLKRSININGCSSSMDSMKIVHINHLLDWFREFAYDDLRPWIGSVYAFQYSLTHITKKKNRIEKDEKTKKTEWKQNKAESKYWAHEVLSAHCDQFHFILSFVHCMVLFLYFSCAWIYSPLFYFPSFIAQFPRYFLLLFVSFFLSCVVCFFLHGFSIGS